MMNGSPRRPGPHAPRPSPLGGKTFTGKPAGAGKQAKHRIAVAEGADVCARVGCRSEGPLYRIERADGRVRTLCGRCIRGWLR